MSDQNLTVQIPEADLALVKDAVRQEFPGALIGTLPQGDGTVLVSIRVAASEPEAIARLASKIGVDQASFQAAPAAAPTLSDLAERVRRQRALEQGGDPA